MLPKQLRSFIDSTHNINNDIWSSHPQTDPFPLACFKKMHSYPSCSAFMSSSILKQHQGTANGTSSEFV